jgi:Probable cobalt transporter subunit (CbtB)
MSEAKVRAVAAPAPIPVRAIPVPQISVRALLPWLAFAALLALVALYFVSAEQGATSVFAGTGVHEWVHDARHLLGFPCH